MTYNVRLSPHAIRDYRKLSPPVDAEVRAALDSLQRHPLNGPKIQRLKGRLRDYDRCRVGDYRVVYAVVQSERVVYVDYIQHRKDVSRRIK